MRLVISTPIPRRDWCAASTLQFHDPVARSRRGHLQFTRDSSRRLPSPTFRVSRSPAASSVNFKIRNIETDPSPFPVHQNSPLCYRDCIAVSDHPLLHEFTHRASPPNHFCRDPGRILGSIPPQRIQSPQTPDAIHTRAAPSRFSTSSHTHRSELDRFKMSVFSIAR